MPIRVECPECGEEYRVPEAAAGKRIRCKECEGPIPVPRRQSQARPRRPPIEDYDDFDDDEDDYDPPPRRRRSEEPPRRSRSNSRSRSQSRSGGGFRWGPLVALVGIPFLFIGFFAGGKDSGLLLGGILMSICFGVSAAISTVQKGHHIGLGIGLAFLGLPGLIVVSFLPDHNKAPAKSGKRRRRR